MRAAQTESERSLTEGNEGSEAQKTFVIFVSFCSIFENFCASVNELVTRHCLEFSRLFRSCSNCASSRGY